MISTFMTLRVDRVDSIPLSTLASAVNSLSIGETLLVSFILQYRYGFLIFIHALRFRLMLRGAFAHVLTTVSHLKSYDHSLNSFVSRLVPLTCISQLIFIAAPSAVCLRTHGEITSGS